MSKMTEYPEVSRFDSGDIIIKDGANGTKKITAANAAVEFAGLVSAINHRNVYRGKNLGTSVSAVQMTAIRNATFDNMFIGDYWRINGVDWVIADMDYFLRCGDTELTKHHLVIVPATSLYSSKMNESNITTEGYIGSEMYKTGLEQAKKAITNAFGSMVLSHKEYLTNAVTNGYPSGGAWYNSTVELMNEIMVYGCHVYAPASNGSVIPNKYTTGKQQLALFALSPRSINIRTNYWLRDVVSASGFALVFNNGGATYYSASHSIGVRPYFIIG